MNIITEGFHLEYLHVGFMQDRPRPLETSCGFILLNFDSFLLLQYPKEVFWYLAETDELEVNLSQEHNNYLWLQFDEAEEQITFEQEKELLRSARRYLRSKGRSL